MPKKFTGLFHVPMDLAVRPEDGACLSGRWWLVHPKLGLAFLADKKGDPLPVCRSHELAARALRDEFYPKHELRRIPAVFLQHATELRDNPYALEAA